jgi:REP-associated tyrosine transposase
VAGGAYFFTVNLLQRYPNDLLVRPIELLRTGVRDVRARWPFHIDAWVVLADHLHCVWTLLPDDDDFTNRWRLIKQRFSKGLSKGEQRSSVRLHAANEASGNAGSGNTLFVTTRIMRGMWIIATSIR